MKLLFINVRGLQAAATGPYGNRSVETFTLNALAAQGVVFDRHLSVHPEPGRAHAVWRTGRYQFVPVDATPDLLAQLRQQGVQTHLLVDTRRPMTAEITAGWEHVHPYPDTASTLEAAGKLLPRLPEAASWLVWLDLSALLPPWEVPEEIVEAYFAPPEPEEEAEDDDDDEPHEEAFVEENGGEDLLESEEEHEPLMDPPLGRVDPADDDLFLRVQKSYAAAISHVDILLGHLLDGMPDDVLVVVTSDHGQSLAEHGVIGPSSSLHAEVAHVPLIFAGAGCRAGRHVGALTASLDVAVTFAELAGTTLPQAQGHSLVAMLATQETAKWPYVGLATDEGGGARALWTAERTLIGPAAGQEHAKLYVKPDDRCEVNDIRQHEMERVEAMERTLAALVESVSAPGPLVLPVLEGAS